jgi:hypothetical protein
MAIPRDSGGGAPRRRQPQTRKRAVVPHPEILRSAPPRPSPNRRIGVFAKPVGRVSPVGNAPRRAAQRTRRAATRLPAEHQLPRFPVLRQYTDKQRQIIRSRTEQAVRKVATQRGIPGHRVVQTLYNEGDRHTRQTLRTYGRVVREQADAQHAHALDSLLTTHISPNLNALTAHERDQFRRSGTVRNPVSQEGKTLVARQRTQARLRLQVDGARLGTSQRAQVYRALTAPRRSQARPGSPVTTGPGAVPLAAARFLTNPNRNLFAAATPGVVRLGRPLLSDAFSLPKDVVNSTYYTGAALYEAARGRPQRLGQLGSALKNHDPLVLAAQGRWNEALKATAQHPLDTLLELGGLRGVGHGIGRLARTDITRKPAVLPTTRLEAARTFSRNPAVKAAQQRREVRRIGRAERLYAQAQAAERSGEHRQEEVDQLYKDAERADPTLMHSRQVEHRADVTEALAQPAKRRGRAELKKAMRPLELRPSEGGHIQRLIVEGHAPVRLKGDGSVDVAALRRDLTSYRDDLKTHAAGLKGRQLKQNTALRARINEGLKLSDDQLAHVGNLSRHIAELTNRMEQRVVAIGGLAPREALTARLKTYAVRHMNGEVRVATDRLEGGSPQLVAKAVRQYTPKQANVRVAQLEKLLAEGNLTDEARTQIRAEVARIRATRTERIYTPLPAEQILAHMKAGGVNPEHVAFVTQRPGGLGPGSFNMRALSKDLTRKGLPTQTRTGQAVIQGLLDTHPSRLTANVVRLQQFEAADRNYVNAIHEVAARSPGGDLRVFTSRKKAEEFRDGGKYNEQGDRIHGAPDWRIVRINPWGGRESQLAHLLEHGDAEGFVRGEKGGVDHPISQAIEEAVSGKALEGEGPWAAVPADWAERIADHADVYRSSWPPLRTLTGFFRNTVLPTSLPWIFGNVSEAAIRTAIHNPRMARNLIFYHRVVKAIKSVDPEEAGRLKDMLGTGHFGMSETSNVYTSVEQFSRSRLLPVAKALAVARRTHGPKQIADAYAKWTEWVFHGNSRVEDVFREAMAGAHMREVFNDRAIGRISAQAVEDAANGLRNTNAQVRMADEVRRAYGQYEAFGPDQRKFIVLYSPFAAWSLNALKFLGVVLPKDHPVLTAALAAQNRATTDWRAKHGLIEGGFLHGKAPVPAFLMGSIPVPGGGHIRAQRYTPFGFFGDPAGSLADMVLPQFSGGLHALQGQKWTGAPLTPHGETSNPEKFWAGFMQELSTFIPFYGRVQQAMGYEGSPQSRFWQTENPLKVVKKKAASTKAGTLPKGYKRPSDHIDYTQLYGSQPTQPELDYTTLYP